MLPLGNTIIVKLFDEVAENNGRILGPRGHHDKGRDEAGGQALHLYFNGAGPILLILCVIVHG